MKYTRLCCAFPVFGVCAIIDGKRQYHTKHYSGNRTAIIEAAILPAAVLPHENSFLDLHQAEKISRVF